MTLFAAASAGDPVREIAWLVPAALALHVAEEAPGFADWARRHASTEYSDGDFVKINALGVGTTMAAAVAVARGYGGRPFLLAFYAAGVTQQALWNPVFHAGTTVAWREYSPGLVTSLTLFVPLWTLITRRVLASGLLRRRGVLAAVAAGGALHAAAVAQQVFRVGRR
jgi:hypothetical protein